MVDPLLEKLVRFQHPERSLGYVRALSDETLASLFGTDTGTYREAVAQLDAQRAEAVRRLAARQDVREVLQHPPFERGQAVVATGESTTADRLSWFELIAALFDAERPNLELRFENLAVAGSTTTQALAGVSALRRASGDWVFCMLGGNDSQRFGGATGTRLVSSAETVRNLRALRDLAQRDEANWVWLSPTPVDEELVAQFRYFQLAGITWTNEDARGLAAELSALGGAVIDAFDAEPVAEPFLDDGVHPSLSAQESLAVHVLTALSSALH
ncbi:SGNH/GDSL hydrolase family protein [Diaminobutyricibacter tongyongensis]|uniref:SGNH/GDSL hydrolase family protein n=1 Tax=Leifsonia tongyongensis TaxID=1268043 RepID=A0A6L9XUC1_9MICO|nr:SGNH/GDSL hydrolase family protein [Diaminobutyricibacter tongyongensis]NEN04992.1 SGNH/GDSL hydrolase family protein [Diaminobutyricibacter tongyongensis]